ncbi:MAG: UDP-N-acetylmuramate--L-alanine ligase [Lachnospiraceae bacterium]|nr:UDP-N-acetylmuramate--L-alanine ligase [Ruminococcus sp.]MCM1274678.1 UDP-N-acetylmuramate--L-alanine ligase [Lachnospiraceae bacterium]
MEDFLTGKKHIHFIGIGGSGMYPLAQILHTKGYYLTGSDNNETATLEAVRKMGIPVTLGQRAENIEGADLIVFSAAIMEDNPELIAAREAAKRGVRLAERAELLGLVTERFSKAFCVSGTHGKTTTSSMLTCILLAADVDPSAVIGGKLRAIGGSGRAGNSEYMVCEACEFKDTFLHLFPNISIILNIDEDHMDYFRNMDNLKASFAKFCGLTTDLIIANGDDENTMDVLRKCHSQAKFITYGAAETNDFYADRIYQSSDFRREFTLMNKGEALCRIEVNVPGLHNVYNAVAACAAAYSAGIPLDAVQRGMESFTGAMRRFEKLAEVNGVTFVDDYGHHPAEIAATLKTAKEMSFKRVWCVHQPFTYSRTAALLDDFAEALSIADRVVLTEIMGSREKNTYGVHSEDLAAKIDGCVWFPTFEEVARHVVKNVEDGDLVITTSCGDVYKVAEMMIEMMRSK